MSGEGEEGGDRGNEAREERGRETRVVERK